MFRFFFSKGVLIQMFLNWHFLYFKTALLFIYTEILKVEISNNAAALLNWLL